MTDKSKYSNITVENKVYDMVTYLQTNLIPGVKLSRSQVVKTVIKKEKAIKLNGRFK